MATTPEDTFTFRIGARLFAVIALPGAGPGEAVTAGPTPAERDVLRLLLSGRSNQEIADVRGTSARTVANQVASLFGKLGVRSRAELAAFASRLPGPAHD